MSKADLFNRPGMLTLTVAREPFGGPLDAYLIISDGGYVRRLMRLLGVKRWLWVLEFQMATGEGWPHWHLLIEVPPGGLDLKRAWRLWRDKWQLGGLDLQVKAWTADARAALLYLSKYLIKFPDKGFPDWLRHLDRRVRWVQGNKAVGPLVSDREAVEKDAKSEEAAESLPRKQRTLAMREVDCGNSVEFFREVVTEHGAKVEFWGRLPLDVFNAGRKGKEGIKLQEDEDHRQFIEGDWGSFREMAGQVFKVAARGNTPWSDRKRIQAMREASTPVEDMPPQALPGVKAESMGDGNVPPAGG